MARSLEIRTVIVSSDTPVENHVHELFVSFPDMSELVYGKQSKIEKRICDVCCHRTACMAKLLTGAQVNELNTFFIDNVPPVFLNNVATKLEKLVPVEHRSRIQLILRVAHQSIHEDDENEDSGRDLSYVSWASRLATCALDGQTEHHDTILHAVFLCVCFEAYMQKTMQWKETFMLDTIATRLNYIVCSQPDPLYPAVVQRKNRTNNVLKTIEARVLDTFNRCHKQSAASPARL
jgi:hypothetical protein